MNLRNKLTLANANPNESTPLSRAIFFIIIGVAFYLLDRFNLFYLDDYLYAYKFGTYDPIRTLKDIFESQCDHYMQFNGRFLVHCVVQLFCGILGIEWFRLFNTFAFCAFCGLTVRFIYNTWRKSIAYYVFVSLAIWLFIPRISFTILGNISCTINYLWVGVASVAFILLLQKVAESKFSVFANIGLGFVGVLIGSLQESFSIPISGALFLYYCFNFKKFRGAIVWLVSGYWLGSLILALAPSNFIRLGQQTTYVGLKSLIFDIIYRTITILSDYKLFFIIGAVIIIGLLFNSKKYFELILRDKLYYLMLLIAILFPILVAYTNSHQLFFAGWLVIVLMLRMVKLRFKTYWSFLVLILFVPMYTCTYKAMAHISEKRSKRIKSVVNSESGYVISEYNANDIMMWPYIIRKYVNVPINDIFCDYVSMYYTGKKDLYEVLLPCSPSQLINMCNDKNEVSKDVFYLSNFKCYVAKIPKGNSRTIQLQVINPILSYDGIINLIQHGTRISKIIIPDYELRNVVKVDDCDYICYYVRPNQKIIHVALS